MPIYVWIWRAAVLCLVIAAFRMFRNRLAQRLPLVFVYLALCATRSLVLMVLRPDPILYRNFYALSAPVVMLAQYAAIVAVFWVMTENYRHFRWLGIVLLEACTIAGVAAATVAQFALFPSAHTLREWALLGQRYMSTVMVIFVLCFRVALPRTPRLALPKCSLRLLNVLILDSILVVGASWFAQEYGVRFPNAVAMVPTMAALLLNLCWIRAAQPEGERTVLPEIEQEQYDTELREVSARVHVAAAGIREF